MLPGAQMPHRGAFERGALRQLIQGGREPPEDEAYNLRVAGVPARHQVEPLLELHDVGGRRQRGSELRVEQPGGASREAVRLFGEGAGEELARLREGSGAGVWGERPARFWDVDVKRQGTRSRARFGPVALGHTGVDRRVGREPSALELQPAESKEQAAKVERQPARPVK